jgi:EpsI family protein
LVLPAQTGSWSASNVAVTRWEPAYSNAVTQAAGTYRSGETSVGLRVAYYRDQGYERKLVTSSNNLVDVEAHGDWAQTASDSTQIHTPAGSLALRTGDLRGSAEPGNPTAQRLRVWHVYWIGGHYTTSDVRARLTLAVNRLLGRGDDSAVVFFYTPNLGASGGAAADEALGAFVTSARPALDALLAGASRRP